MMSSKNMQLPPKLIENMRDDSDASWIVVVGGYKVVLNGFTDCRWLDTERQFIAGIYGDWAGNELFAIINLKGEVIRNAIRSIENVLHEHKLFIVEMSGFGMEGEARQYDLDDDDWKMAVVDTRGRFVIPPLYHTIYFDEFTNLLIAKNYDSRTFRFDFDGTRKS